MDFQTLQLLFRCRCEFSHDTLRLRELSDTEYMICSYVRSHADCSQDEAATALKTDKTTVAKALHTLEEKGCIERIQDPADKRRKRLNLTASGLERTETLLALHERWFSEVFSCLTAEERICFESCCERLLAKAETLAAKEGRA